MKDRSVDYPHLYPDLRDWPIYRLHADRASFVEALVAEVLRKINAETRDQAELLQTVIYAEKTRVRNEPWKVDPPNELVFWRRMERKLVERGLDPVDADDARERQEVLEAIVRRYAEEVVGDFSIPTFHFARRFLRVFFQRLLTAATGRNLGRLFSRGIDLQRRLIVGGQVEQLRALFPEHHVVLLPTHFSNLDSILLGYALDEYGGIPHSTFGAGLNLLNSGWAAYFINRFGAYRVDRRKKNAVYLEVLKSFSRLAIHRGVNSTFFPGGTRSRNGALEDEVKLGLLGTAVEAQRRLLSEGSPKRVIVVPVVLSYHFVLEAKFLIQQYLRQTGKEQYLGAPSSQFTYKGFLKFLWQLFRSASEIYITVGQALDVLGNPVDVDGRSYLQADTSASQTPPAPARAIELEDYFKRDGVIVRDTQREREYTKILGAAVVDRFHRDNVVLTSHVVAYAAFRVLRQFYPDLDLYGVLRLVAEDFIFDLNILREVIQRLQLRLQELERRGRVQLSDPMRGTPAEILRDGVANMQLYHQDPPLTLQRGRLTSHDFHLLYYYHNRLTGYPLAAATRITFKGGVRSVRAARLALRDEEPPAEQDAAVAEQPSQELPLNAPAERQL